jgi:hypothetical protein
MIVDQNSVVAISGMRDAEACWIPNIGRIDDFRTSGIRDAPTCDVQDRKIHYHYYF